MKSETVRNTFDLVKGALKRFIDNDGMQMSAALAYYCAFSIAPLLLIAVSIAGAIFGEDAAKGALENELRHNFGPHVATAIQDLLANARKPSDNILISAFGVLLLLIGATGAFAQIQSSLNKIWRASDPKPEGIIDFFRHRLMSFSMVLVTGFLLLVAMALTTSLQLLSSFFGKTSGPLITSWIAGSGLLSFAVATLLFASLFKILPDTRIRWRDVWLGALFTALLFTVGKFAIGAYLGREATASSYGSAGSFVVLLMWLYYSSAILFLGAEFTVMRSLTNDDHPHLNDELLDEKAHQTDAASATDHNVLT